ncbi:MAG: hypothetical protein E7Z74_00120 [Methanobrevibacter millerae]|uniref:Uncharacterized protein n=1 Tax=Methanobrevibacter millerae TaxID=230361 RepID=A0A8T3VDX0_9EURY|nr:hypothetical protein [Methanobrevibacter millerae]
MSEENLDDYRLDKPMDHLHQRLFDNNCPTMHELFNFPGKFPGRCPNKNANSDGSMAEVDISYLTLMENDQLMIPTSFHVPSVLFGVSPAGALRVG